MNSDAQETAPPAASFTVTGALSFAWQRVSERPFAAAVLFLLPILAILVVGTLGSVRHLIVVPEGVVVLFGVSAFAILLPLALAWPVAWLRYFLFEEVQAGNPIRLGAAEFRFLAACFLLHLVGTLAVMPGFIVAILMVIVVEGIMVPEWVRWFALPIAMGVAYLTYFYVAGRLGPSLAIGLLRNRILVTVSWKPTKPIRLKLSGAWLLWGLAYFVVSMVLPIVDRAMNVMNPIAALVIASCVAVAVAALFVSALGITSYTARYLLAMNPDLGREPGAAHQID
jgi:hypothetical protein